MHKIKIVDSINDVQKDDWNSIVGDNVFASYEWLKTFEETYSEPINPKYILVQDSDELIGASICYIVNKTNQFLSLDNHLLGRLKKYTQKTRISFMPAFICRPMCGIGIHSLVTRKADPKKMGIIRYELLMAIEKTALDHNIAIGFSDVTENEVELIELLKRKGYKKTLGLPFSYLDIEWSSFEEYKKHVSRISKSKSLKNKIVNQINRNRREGVIIKKLENLDGYEDRLYELVNNNHYKHNRTLYPFKREFFRRLKENLGEDVVIYVSIKKDRLTGVCVLLKRNKVGYFPVIGIDHEMAGNDYTYFNIGYYRPIADAILDQTKRLYFGKGMYELKFRRGCKISNTYIFYKPFNKIMKIAIEPWFFFLTLLYKNKMSKKIKRSI